MKKNILVLALGVIGMTTFAQVGIKDLKKTAKDVKTENVNTDAVTNQIEEKKSALENEKSKLTDKANEQLDGKAADLKNVVSEKNPLGEEGTKIAVGAADALTNGKVTAAKEAKEAMTAELKLKRDQELDALKGNTEALTAKSSELKSEVANKEAAVAEKRESAVSKAAVLQGKISAAEEKLSILEGTGLAPAELAQKSEAISNAKAKLAVLNALIGK